MQLAPQVLWVWVTRFAWDGPALLQADVLIQEMDQDAFIDVLAEFVWNHRSELAHLLGISGETQ